ncbi:MAG: FAD binding domain-containing protein, partial [Terriglobia bacterium]
EVIVPIDGPGVGTTYHKVAQPASGFAVVGIAVRLKREGEKISMARIGVTGLSNRAYRATHTEAALVGRTGKPAEIQAAAELVAQGADANSDIHASAAYRTHLAVVHAARAIATALARTA